MKFKVGDKVRYVGGDSSTMAPFGYIGTIVSICPHRMLKHTAEVDSFYIYLSCLELVNKKISTIHKQDNISMWEQGAE